MSSHSTVPSAPLKTPSPRGHGGNLRAHSPWTACRIRKKGRQLPFTCEVSPEQDSEQNAEDAQGRDTDTQMQDLQDLNMQMQQLCVGKERGRERSNAGASVHFSGHQNPAPPAARGARQRLVTLRSGAHRRDQGPPCFPAAAALQPGNPAGGGLTAPGFVHTASETGPAPSLFPDPCRWLGTAVPTLACLGQYPSASFGSDGVLRGAPQAPHTGPSPPHSAVHPQPQQHSLLGLASSAEGALLGGAAAREAAASRAASSHQHLHSLSAEGPLGPKAAEELQQSSAAGVRAGTADAASCPEPTYGAAEPSRLWWHSSSSSSSGVLEGLGSAFSQGVHGTTASAHASQQLGGHQQPTCTTHPLTCVQHPTSTSKGTHTAAGGHPLLRADFDDASRIARGAAPEQKASVPPAQLHGNTHQPSPAPPSTQRCHRRTSSSGSGGPPFKISSSLFCFPRCSHDGDDSGQEQEVVQGPASTPGGEMHKGGGAVEDMLHSGGRDVAGGEDASVHCYGRAGYYSGASTDRKAPPGKGRRAPTPAGNLLSRPMLLEDSTEDDFLSCALQHCSDQMLSGGAMMSVPGRARSIQRKDGSAGRDRSTGGSSGMRSKTSSCAVALKSSGSLAARSRYAQNAVASGEGTGIGVGVGLAAEDGKGGHRGSLLGHRSRGAMSDAFGSWGVAAADDDDDHAVGMWGGASPQHSQLHNSMPPAEDDLEHLMCDEDDFITPPHSPAPAGRGGRGEPAAAAAASESTRKEGAYAAGEAALQLRRERCAGTSAAEQRSEQQATHAASALSPQPPAPAHWLPPPQQHMGAAFPLLSSMQQQQHPATAALPFGARPHAWGPAEPAPTLQQGSVAPTHSMCMSPPFQPVEPLTGWVGEPGGSGSSSAHRRSGPRDLFDARPQEDGSRDIMMEADQEEGAGPLALDSLVCLEDFNGYMSKAAAHGDGGRALLLWSELQTRNIAPDLRTLNMLMRCLSKTAADPDHAENLMSEMCACGGLKPNETTHILLTEIRLRFEQLLGM